VREDRADLNARRLRSAMRDLQFRSVSLQLPRPEIGTLLGEESQVPVY